MTEALANLFGDHDIRVLEKDGEVWFPIYDLSKAWGIDQSTIPKQIERHPDDFKGCVSDVDILSTGSAIKCVNEPGLYAVLAITSIKTVKNPGAKEVIRKFRATAPRAIQAIRKKEIAPAQSVPEELDEVVAYDLREAAQIAELTKVDPKMMQAAILRKHGYKELADVLAPPIIRGESGWHKPGDLARQCGLTTEMFNHYLENNPKDPDRRPFQYKDHDTRLWRLTPLGMEYGAEYPYTVEFTGHTEVRIKWRDSILQASGLKRDIAPDQMQIPARVGQ